MADSTNVDDKHGLNGGSDGAETSPSVMLKPWMKTLGKEFYQNDVLGKYDSLKDAVNGLLERPTKKDIPESYGLRDGSDEVFRKVGLTGKEAKSIDEYYSKFIPEKMPELKEVFGDSYDDTVSLYSKGVDSISSDLKEEITKNGLDKNPTFVRILARVGKETGGKPFVINPANESKKKTNRFIDIINNAK